MEKENKKIPYSAEGNLMETKTSQLDDMLLDTLEQAMYRSTEQERTHEVGRIVAENTFVDLAIVVSHLPAAFRFVVFENIEDIEDRAEFLINTNRMTRRTIFKQLSDKEVCTILEAMPSDEAVSILDEFSEARYNAVVALLDVEKTHGIRELQQYEFNTAGRLMTNEFFAFSRDTTIAVAAEYIRNNPNIDFTRSIFVLDDDGTLEGYVLARNFIISAPSVELRQIMKPVINKVTPDASRSEVIDIVERYKISTLPVVDDDILIGIITHDDVVEMMEEVADDTIAQIAGTVEDVGEHEPVLKRFIWRAPWLVVTLCSGFAMATTLSSLQHRMWYAIASFFVPLITGMSGNVGIQCSTLLVRSMATGELSKRSQRATMIKEMMLAVFTGLVFGSAGALVIYGLHFVGFDPIPVLNVHAIAAIVGAGIFGACITAGTLGVVSPFFFARIGVDPAVASGPIVTACNDFFSMLIFCVIAHTISSFIMW